MCLSSRLKNGGQWNSKPNLGDRKSLINWCRHVCDAYMLYITRTKLSRLTESNSLLFLDIRLPPYRHIHMEKLGGQTFFLCLKNPLIDCLRRCGWPQNAYAPQNWWLQANIQFWRYRKICVACVSHVDINKLRISKFSARHRLHRIEWRYFLCGRYTHI